MQQFHSKAMPYGPTITTVSPLVSGEVALTYANQLTGIGGTPPYAWSVVSGSVPAGLSLASTGLLSGTPTTQGANVFGVQFTDANGLLSNVASLGLTVASQVQISTAVSGLPVGLLNVPYTATLAATGGAAPYTWSLFVGSLQAGLSLNPSTGVISGTPTQFGTTTCTWKVTDALGGFAQQIVNVVINQTAANKYVGTNLGGISYFSPELPFLNIVKAGGGNGVCPQTSWMCSTSAGSTSSTGEEGNLSLDANGYVKSLTGLVGGQTFTCVNLLMNFNTTTPPGASFPYGRANIVYRLQFTGQGVIRISGDGVSYSLTNATTGTVSGTFTVVTPTNGLIMSLTSIGGVTATWPTNISVVDNAQASAYDGGAIFHPVFLASLTGNYSRLRFMDWLRTNNTMIGVAGANFLKFTGAIAANALSATLTSNWTGFTGVYPMVIGDFSYVPSVNAQIVQAHMTFGSAAVTFTTGPTLAMSATCQGFIHIYADWAHRPTFTSAFWIICPYEVCMALCNAISADCWLNIPIWANNFESQSGFWTSLAQLAFNGTGSTLPGFTGLNSFQKVYVEYSNEVWNGSFGQGQYSYVVGISAFVSSNGGFYAAQEWYGMTVAQIADAFFAVYGATPFAGRVVVSMGGQAGPAVSNGTSFLIEAMNTPDWTSRAYTHHIGAIHTSPYFSINGVSNADANAILATAVPLDTFFGMFYSSTYNSITYASLNSSNGANGAIGAVVARSIAQAGASGWGNQVWGQFGASPVPLLGYESGSAFQTNGVATSGNAAWQALIVQAHRDVRMRYVYYDPASVMFSTYNYPNSAGQTGFLPAIYAATYQSINQFNDCQTINVNGEYGALESVQQTISPLTSAPPKFQGIVRYITNQ